MTQLIVPAKRDALYGSGSVREFMKDQPYRDNVAMEDIPAWDPKDADQIYGLVNVITTDAAAFKGVYDWFDGPIGNHQRVLFEILNKVKLAHFESITLKSGDEISEGQSYFFDVETTTGSLTFHLVLSPEGTKTGGRHESTNVWFIGRGDLFTDFCAIADTTITKFLSTAFLREIRKQVSHNLEHFPRMNFLAQHGTPVNGHDPFENRALERGIINVRQPIRHELVEYVAEGDTAHWHKVGDKLSGASLVTRIRQGRIEEIPSWKYKAKSVKDPATGQYSIWVQYSTEPQVVEAPTDADSLAMQAWERIEDKVKSLFMEEFKSLL